MQKMSQALSQAGRKNSHLLEGHALADPNQLPAQVSTQ